jgi:hypothetical protein
MPARISALVVSRGAGRDLIRPLLALSDYVVTTMPIHFAAVGAGRMGPHELMDEAEAFFASVDPAIIGNLLSSPGSTQA